MSHVHPRPKANQSPLPCKHNNTRNRLVPENEREEHAISVALRARDVTDGVLGAYCGFMFFNVKNPLVGYAPYLTVPSRRCEGSYLPDTTSWHFHYITYIQRNVRSRRKGQPLSHFGSYVLSKCRLRLRLQLQTRDQETWTYSQDSK